MKDKILKATALGIWYQQIPSMLVINPLGEIVDPKYHNGSWYVVIKSKPVAVSNPKIPKLNYTQAMRFKEIFYY